MLEDPEKSVLPDLLTKIMKENESDFCDIVI